jgi:hypothetical protein
MKGEGTLTKGKWSLIVRTLEGRALAEEFVRVG